jgi:hypothetical protein
VRGLTNEVASSARTPAAISASMICAFVSIGISFGSDWKPSRVPTSVMATFGRGVVVLA